MRIFLCKCIFVTSFTRFNKQSPRSRSKKFIVCTRVQPAACRSGCAIFETVINPCQVQGYENLYDRCVVLPIIHFVTFILQPNTAATSSPSSPHIRKKGGEREKKNPTTSGLRSSYILSPAAVFLPSTWIQSCPSPQGRKVGGIWSGECEIWCDSVSYFVTSVRDPRCVITSIVNHVWLGSRVWLP